ncbi:MAG TPA: hypothetical protein VFU70_06600 [Pseudolabrys sp.]|nr:hypothetical protein [Pseudolabrys sp.]
MAQAVRIHGEGAKVGLWTSHLPRNTPISPSRSTALRDLAQDGGGDDVRGGS